MFAGTNYVSQSGSHTPPFDTWAKAAHDIQSAVTAADPDNLVLVKGDTYFPVSTISIAKNLTVKSADGAGATIIDGGYGIVCINVGAGNIIIDGFTVTKGKGLASGGGIQIAGGYAEVKNCVIHDNSAADAGGGIVSLIYGTISNCVISGNTALAGGGLAFYAGGTVVDCIITNNIATGSVQSFGGGVLSFVGGYLKRCTIVDNKSFYGGGGVGLLIGGKIEDCTISGNTSILTGGGVHIDSQGLVMRSTVSGNNTAMAGGIYCKMNSTVRECFIKGNTATVEGGGISCVNASKVINSVITGNTAGGGGGVYSQNSTLENCTIVSNAASIHGEGLYCENGSNINCIIYYNINLVGENIYNATSSIYSHCCSLPAMYGEANTSIDPAFVDYPSGNYQLSLDSPCIEGGVVMTWMSGAKDIAGNDRIRGDTVDMGAYEYPLTRVKSSEWKVKSKKTKGTVKGKYITPSLSNYFQTGWQIGLKNGETGAVIDGPRELLPNKSRKIWKFKEKKEAQVKYKAKKDILVYKVWTAIPPTNIVFLVSTNAPALTPLHPLEFNLIPAGKQDDTGWQKLINK
jgi:hypothetical protein